MSETPIFDDLVEEAYELVLNTYLLLELVQEFGVYSVAKHQG